MRIVFLVALLLAVASASVLPLKERNKIRDALDQAPKALNFEPGAVFCNQDGKLTPVKGAWDPKKELPSDAVAIVVVVPVTQQVVDAAAVFAQAHQKITIRIIDHGLLHAGDASIKDAEKRAKAVSEYLKAARAKAVNANKLPPNVYLEYPTVTEQPQDYKPERRKAIEEYESQYDQSVKGKEKKPPTLIQLTMDSKAKSHAQARARYWYRSNNYAHGGRARVYESTSYDFRHVHYTRDDDDYMDDHVRIDNTQLYYFGFQRNGFSRSALDGSRADRELLQDAWDSFRYAANNGLVQGGYP